MKGESIATFDFSILYTSLPLQTIYMIVSKHLLFKMYINNGSHIININNYKETYFWSNTEKTGYTNYSIDNTLQVLYFLLFNSFVRYGPYIFRQVQGFPMGLPASGYIATLYLSWLEFQFMEKLTKTDYDLAKKLPKMSRYLDDINTHNIKNFANIAKQNLSTKADSG